MKAPRLMVILALLTIGVSAATLRAADPAGDAKFPPRVVDRAVTVAGKPPAADDTLLLYYGDDPDTLNVVTSSDNVSDALQRHVYEPLGQRTFSDPDKWELVLAESVAFDAEKLEYTIRLRKGIMWHPITLPSGKTLPATELTARDVKFTFDCILNEFVEAASLRSYYIDPSAPAGKRSKITVSTVPGDKYTIKVRWKSPYFLADDFTLGNFVLPRHVYGMDEQGEPISFDFLSKEFAKGFNGHWANETMCGTGPMIFQEWVKNGKVEMARNPDYWGNPAPFSRIVYKNISNPQTAVQQLLQNDLDWGSIPEKDQYVQAKKHKNVLSGQVSLKEFTQPAYRFIGYNQRREFFKDKRVRWALSHAVPVDDIIAKIYYGLATRTTGHFLPGSSAYDTSIEPVKFDLVRARKLLDEAGWKDTNGNGVRDKEVDGQRIEAEFDMMIYTDSPSYQTIAEILKENWRRIGVDVNIAPTPWALMLQKLRKKDFDATIFGWISDWKTDPFQIFHGSQADEPESSNSIVYRNEELDKLIEELRVTMDEAKQVELYHKIHRILHDDQPYTFFYADLATGALHHRVENWKSYKIRPSVNVREWHTTAPRAAGP